VESQSFTGEARNGLLAHAMLDRGFVLKVLRQYGQRGMTQKALAKSAGLSLSTIQRAEQGAGNISDENWRAIATALDTDVAELDRRVDAFRLAADVERELAASEHAEQTRARTVAAKDDLSLAGSDYLDAMQLWWSELSPDDRERVFDFARKLRDEAREARKKIAG
jgi:transcriptional regulator with XRE-family HTH domain